jgi:undecaprenyl diphosphate synthase
MSTPKHIAVILDGNGRWAEARGLARSEGHRQGGRRLLTLIQQCLEREIPYLTLFAFSVANWARPREEVGGIMAVVSRMARELGDFFVQSGVRAQFIGELGDVPEKTHRDLEAITDLTRHCTKLVLTTALNYGSRRDLAAATRALAREACEGRLQPEEIDESAIRRWLATRDLPDPDLVIRTGGEQRLSDFLLFESAHAEIYFTAIPWPDFDDEAFERALAEFAQRERRFGRTSRQARGAEPTSAAATNGDGPP